MRSHPSCWNKTLAQLGFRRKRRKPRSRRDSYRRRSLFENLEARQMLTVTVDTLVDENDGMFAGGISLRDAIAEVATNSAQNTIDFASGMVGEITLVHGELDITNDVEIAGPGDTQLTISGNDLYRVFDINSGVGVEISNLSITGGSAIDGAGIHNRGNLTLDTVKLHDNEASNYGGALFHSTGSLTVSNSTVESNRAKTGGGFRLLMDSASTGDVWIESSTFVGNLAEQGTEFSGGGAIHALGSFGQVEIVNSTFSGNRTRNIGGAIRAAVGANLSIVNSTITDNEATLTDGGGVSFGSGVTPLIQNTIIYGNRSVAGKDDIFVPSGLLQSSTRNLIGENYQSTFDASVNIIDDDPLLVPLADNGGPTKTHALLPGSPALDQGDDTHFTDLIPTNPGLIEDQRGFHRNQDSVAGLTNTVDIGAFELQEEVVAAADVNGDGRQDKVFRDTLTGNLNVLLDLGDRYATSSWGSLGPVGADWTDFQAGDFNGDGRDDLWAFNSSPSNSAAAYWTLLVSDGNAFFTTDTSVTATWPDSPAGNPQVVVGDFDGDGVEELLGRTSFNANWSLVQYDETQGAEIQTDWGRSHLVDGWKIFVHDANADGRDDLLALSATNNWRVATSTDTAYTLGSPSQDQNWTNWFDGYLDPNNGSIIVGAQDPYQQVLDEFSWVYNNVELELYPGLMKGITATEQTKAGNPWDQAALLVDKLENLYGPGDGIEADIATGKVEVEGEELAAWLGIDDPLDALNVVRSTLDGFATQSITVNGSTTTTVVEFTHAWVRAKVPTIAGFDWVDLDPSWKFQERLEGIAVNLDPTGTGNGTFDEFEYLKLSTDNKQLPIEFYEDQVQQYLAVNAATQGKSLADVSREGANITKLFETIPEGLGSGVTIVDVNSNGPSDDVATYDNANFIYDDSSLSSQYTHRFQASVNRPADSPVITREENIIPKASDLADYTPLDKLSPTELPLSVSVVPIDRDLGWEAQFDEYNGLVDTSITNTNTTIVPLASENLNEYGIDFSSLNDTTNSIDLSGILESDLAPYAGLDPYVSPVTYGSIVTLPDSNFNESYTDSSEVPTGFYDYYAGSDSTILEFSSPTGVYNYQLTNNTVLEFEANITAVSNPLVGIVDHTLTFGGSFLPINLANLVYWFSLTLSFDELE